MKFTKDNWETLVIQITPEMHRRFRLMASEKGLPMSVLFRQIIASECGLGDEHIYVNENQLALKNRRRKNK